MDDALEAVNQRLRYYLRRLVPGRRDLLPQPPETPLVRPRGLPAAVVSAFAEGRRYPFSVEDSRGWQVEPQQEAEGAFGCGKPVRLLVLTGVLVLDVEVKRAVAVVAERVTIPEREPVEFIGNREPVRVVNRYRPERATGGSSPASKCRM